MGTLYDLKAGIYRPIHMRDKEKLLHSIEGALLTLNFNGLGEDVFLHSRYFDVDKTRKAHDIHEASLGRGLLLPPCLIENINPDYRMNPRTLRDLAYKVVYAYDKLATAAKMRLAAMNSQDGAIKFENTFPADYFPSELFNVEIWAEVLPIHFTDGRATHARQKLERLVQP